MRDFRRAVVLLLACLWLPVMAACAASEPAAVVDGPKAEAAKKTAPATAVTRRAAPGAPKLGAADTLSAGLLVQLSRGACFGRCPQYTVQIAEDGAVVFTGVRFVAAEGEQQGQADPARLQALLAYLDQPQVDGLQDIYSPGGKGCGQVTTDMSSIDLQWRRRGVEHRLRLYQGCEDAPAVLKALPQAIDDAAMTRQWIKDGLVR